MISYDHCSYVFEHFLLYNMQWPNKHEGWNFK